MSWEGEMTSLGSGRLTEGVICQAVSPIRE